jgi:hypothetical protein
MLSKSIGEEIALSYKEKGEMSITKKPACPL